MKLTNKFDLPQTFVNVIQRPTYTKGGANISATELINSPRIVQLKQKHWADLEQDASEMVWSLFGSAVHNILEHGKDAHHVVEQRLHAEIDGWSISGAIDLQEVVDDGIIISDDKTTGAWAVMNSKIEWDQQLNIYAWLVEHVKKIPVKKVQIIAIVRDWSSRDSKTREGYPKSPVVTLDIPLWPMEERESFVRHRIAQHSAANFAMTMEETLPECTPEQMWEKPTTYAVKKEGAVRAKSIHSTHEEAAAALTKGYVIEIRNGERTRCKSFCQVSGFCDQHQKYLRQQGNSND
jgi:hypothetical protein